MKKKIFFYGAVTLLALSFSACKHYDPTFETVAPPTVEIAPNTLSGIVTDMQGKPLQGATVKLGANAATTGTDGIYNFDNVTEGTYTISAEAAGKVGVSEQFVIAKSATTRHLVWNATLATINTKPVNVTVDEGGSGEVESEALETNDEGRIEIQVEVPGNVVPENTRITITPIYTTESAEVIRSARAEDDETMLIGATLGCSDENLQLTSDIDLTFNLDESVATSVVSKMYLNGQWIEVPSRVVDHNVVISAREFTSYGIFLKVDVSTIVKAQALDFVRSEWDNFYGDSDIYVESAAFDYKLGTEITTRAANKLEGLLIEHLSRLFGATVQTRQGTYPLNVNLPIGTALRISGSQEIIEITVSGNTRSVKGTSYGTVGVNVATSSRDHQGSGSTPD